MGASHIPSRQVECKKDVGGKISKHSKLPRWVVFGALAS